MADALPFTAYLKAAFNFRPFGMFVAPNWIALGIAGLLGVLNPGFWLLGLAGEGIYLGLMLAHPRFRALVDLHHRGPPGPAEPTGLAPQELQRYERLRSVAAGITAAPDEPDAAREDRAALITRMLGVHLRLLQRRQELRAALARQDADVPRRLADVRARLATIPAGPVRDSLEDQAAVLGRRAEAWEATRERVSWIDAELGRIEEHVGLLRDRSLLRGDGARELATEVDRVADLLAGADRWLREEAALGEPESTDRPRPREGVTR